MRWSRALSTLTKDVDTARVDAGWDRVRAARGSRPRLARRAMVAAPLLAIAAVLFLIIRAVPALPAVAPVAPVPPGAPIALSGGASLPSEWEAPAAVPAPLVVALDDGSRLELAPQTHMRSGKGAADRVELGVDRGRATFDVKPGGARAWVIDAGPVVVRVLGTRFTVARDGARAAAPASPEPTPAPTPTPTPTPTPALAPADPMTQADALRRQGRPTEAATTLRALSDSGDRRAPLAAFTLGKIHAEDLHDPAGSARWFERAIALGLPSGLDEEAHARAVECYARAGMRADTARAAARYEARFPQGRHLARVKEWARD